MYIPFFILCWYVVFFAILVAILIDNYIYTNRRKEEARKAIDDVFNMELSKNEPFKATLDRIVWENFEVPLIHSTKHNATIYATKADA